MIYLKQSTSVVVNFGPFVDKTDGVALETGLATAMDNATTGIRLSKNGAAYADRGDATTPAYDAMGDYRITLSTTDTGSLGVLRMVFEEAATTLPVFKEMMVITANAYDSLVLGTDVLTADLTQIGGVAQSATDLKDFADAGYDPATNKVQGVVLVDTATTVTGGATASALSTAQSDLDTITGSDGATLATAQGLYAPSKAGDSMDILSISGDATAADNLELMYDGTGYTDATGPASRAQVENIGAASGGSLAFQNEADNIGGAIKTIVFDGVETSGTNSSVDFNDGIYHVIDDVTDNIDIVYQFDVGGGRTAVEVVWKGYLDGINDEFTIQVYNGSGWDTLVTVAGQNGADNITETHPLFSAHTGTGADLGKVFIRLECATQSNPTLNSDQLYVSAVNIGQSVGYALGRVWIDTNTGIAGTEPFVNGTADNKSLSLTDGTTIAGTVGLSSFDVAPGSSVTLIATYADAIAYIYGATLVLNGQDISNTITYGGDVSGITTGTGPVHFIDSALGTVTFPPAHFDNCSLTSTFTMGSTGDFTFSKCYSEVTSGQPVIDFAALGACQLNMRAYSGGIEIQNMAAGDTMSLEGDGALIINANCSAGTISYRGNFKLTDNSGSVTIVTDDNTSNVDTMVAGIITGAAVTGTLSTTQASSNLTGYTADQLIGRIITVTSGVAEGESSDITDYVETNGVLTFTAMTLAMGNTDTFKIT